MNQETIKISTDLPASCQHLVSILSAYCQHLVSILSAYCQHLVSILSASCQHIVSILSASCQHIVSILSASCQILPLVPKIFEKIMSNKLSTYFEKNYSKFQCGSRKSFSSQHCLFLMLEKWKHAADNKKVFGALLTDLSKAFDCIYHDLLIAKLNALLQNRKRRTENGTVCSLCEELFSGVAQRLILGHSYLKYFSAIYF